MTAGPQAAVRSGPAGGTQRRPALAHSRHAAPRLPRCCRPAKALCPLPHRPPRCLQDLTEEELTKLREEVDRYTIEGDLRRFNSLNIKRLKEIGCYRGRRHYNNLPVRGQRTKNNARTRKGASALAPGGQRHRPPGACPASHAALSLSHCTLHAACRILPHPRLKVSAKFLLRSMQARPSPSLASASNASAMQHGRASSRDGIKSGAA